MQLLIANRQRGRHDLQRAGGGVFAEVAFRRDNRRHMPEKRLNGAVLEPVRANARIRRRVDGVDVVDRQLRIVDRRAHRCLHAFGSVAPIGDRRGRVACDAESGDEGKCAIARLENQRGAPFSEDHPTSSSIKGPRAFAERADSVEDAESDFADFVDAAGDRGGNGTL